MKIKTLLETEISQDAEKQTSICVYNMEIASNRYMMEGRKA